MIDDVSVGRLMFDVDRVVPVPLAQRIGCADGDACVVDCFLLLTTTMCSSKKGDPEVGSFLK